MADSEPRWYAGSIRELAVFFRVKYGTARSWQWLPERTSKGYDLAECAERRYVRLSDTPRVQADNVSASQRQLRNAKLEEEVRRIKLENDTKAGHLVSAHEVGFVMTKWANQIGDALMGLAWEIGALVPSNKSAVMHQTEQTVRRVMAVANEPPEVTKADFEQWVLAEADRIRERGKAKGKKR